MPGKGFKVSNLAIRFPLLLIPIVQTRMYTSNETEFHQVRFWFVESFIAQWFFVVRQRSERYICMTFQPSSLLSALL